jgi:ABC-type methionine transport system permease subunit
MSVFAASMPWSDIPDLLRPALGETLEMVAFTALISFAIGIPIAVLLENTTADGLFPARPAHAVLSWLVGVGRSLPFLILMVAIIPFTKFVVGSSIGIAAAVVPLSVGATFWVARLVENSMREVPPEVLAVGQASAGSRLQIIWKVQLAEAVPSILGALTIATIAILDLSAMAGAVGAGGIGNLALTYGYQRFDGHVMLASVVVLVVLVQIIQILGDALVRITTKG